MALQRRSLLAASALAALPSQVRAQPAWPSRPIRVIVPFPAGAGSDLLARVYAQRLSDVWGQPIVVENRAGASGIIGTEAASRAPKDGYTILMANAAVLSSGPAVNTNLPYDPIGGFDPVALVGSNDAALVVRASSPFRTVADLLAAARARPDTLSFSSAGTGTSTHMAGEYMKQMAGVSITHVPYRGTPQALTDTIAGVVDMTMATINTAIPVVRDGQARALATTGATRDPLMPDVPTFSEVGLTGYTASGWLGFVVPAGVPAEIIARMSAGIRQVYDEPGFQQRVAGLGMRPVISTPEEFRAMLAPELARWITVARQAGVRTD